MRTSIFSHPLAPLVLVSAAMAAAPAFAACPTDLEVALMAARHANLEVVANPSRDMTLSDALCGRDKFVRFLAQNNGRAVGYKAGLTSAAAQKQFGVAHPVRGTLFEKMLLRDGAEVPAKFGARPVFEADLVVEVKDAGINTARTPLEALRHVARIYPFIELPDLMVENPRAITGPIVAYINVGTRLGVLGEPLEVKPSQALLDALSTMKVTIVDNDGKQIDSASGSALLDNPMHAVLWLASDLRRQGGVLRKGELLSLGSFSRPHPPKPGMTVKVSYDGLPGNPSVSVRFR